MFAGPGRDSWRRPLLLNTIKFVKSWADELEREEEELKERIATTSDPGKRDELEAERDEIARLRSRIGRGPARLTSLQTPPLQRQQPVQPAGRGVKRGRDPNDDPGPPRQINAIEAEPPPRPQQVGIGASRPRRSASRTAVPKTLSEA